MSDILHILARIIVIVVGYCIALVAAGGFLAAIFYSQLDALDYVFNDNYSPFYWDQFFEDKSLYTAAIFGAMFFAVLVTGFSALPVFILILISEIKGVKSSLFFCIGGLLISILFIARSAIYTVTDPDIAPHLPLIYGSYASAGIIAGFVYWLIAGRNAGRFLNRPAQ